MLRCTIAIGLLACVLVSPAYGSIIPGSEGFVTFIGNDANPTGSFKVNAAYQVYDGTSVSDPLGANSKLQLAFVLDHQGADTELPALDVGRFTAFAPSGSGTTIAFYTALSVINPGSAGQYLVGPAGSQLDPFGGVAPLSTNIDPPPNNANRGKFHFWNDDIDQLPAFAPGQHSQLLVLTPRYNTGFPADIVIELDVTLTVPQIKSDLSIHVVPEPATAVLLGLSLLLVRKGRSGR